MSPWYITSNIYFTDHLKLIPPHIQKIEYFSDGCAGQYRIGKTFTNYVSINLILELEQCGISFQPLTGNHHVMALGEE